jgi:hypothetical protein
MIAVQRGEPMQASAVAQVHPNVHHPIYEELWRDAAMKYGCK